MATEVNVSVRREKMKEEMAGAFSCLSLALGLNQLETEFLKFFVGTIIEEKKSTEKEINAWRERIGEEIFDYLYSLTEKWIAFYFICLAKSGEIKPGEGISEEDEGIYEGDFREASRTFETVIGNGFHKYQLVLLRIECFRDGKLIELTGIDGEFLNFVREMKKRFPDIHFEPSVDFYSSEEDEVGYGFPTDMTAFTTEKLLEAKISLLHEIGHCLLTKKRRENLSHLVEVVEAGSWDIAQQEAQELGLTSEPDWGRIFRIVRERSEDSHALWIARHNIAR